MKLKSQILRKSSTGLSARQGQSTIEYILLVTAVVAVMLIISRGIFPSKLKTTVTTTMTGLTTMASTLTSAIQAH